MWEGLQHTQTLMQIEKESHQSVKRLFKILNEKFRPQHNDTMLSLHYCMLGRQNDETAEEWMVITTEINTSVHVS